MLLFSESVFGIFDGAEPGETCAIDEDCRFNTCGGDTANKICGGYLTICDGGSQCREGLECNCSVTLVDESRCAHRCRIPA